MTVIQLCKKHADWPDTKDLAWDSILLTFATFSL